MLKFSLKRIFALRGIEKRPAFLVKHGFSRQQASKFLRHDNPLFKVEHLERLCIALNCTPSDLFNWTPDAQKSLPEMHSLNALHQTEKTFNLQQLVKDVPSDRLALIANLLEELKK